MTATAVQTAPLFVYGASGMLAGELFRLVEQHPGLRLAGAASRTSSVLAHAHPHVPLRASSSSWEETDAALADALASGEPAAVALALPHGESAAAWRRLSELGPTEGLRLVDLAADFRLRDPSLYRRAYGHEHPAPLALADFVYGLPEMRRDAIRAARQVAAPGCFATAMQLAVLPAARAGLLDGERPWILHGITGSSGSGNEPKPGTHHPHRHGNLWAYGLEGHRHEAELVQALREHGLQAKIHFLPHSGPFARGIHLTAALPLRRATSAAEAFEVFRDAYAGEPFVDVLERGVPDLRSIAASNRVVLSASVRGEVLTVLLALDNLVKGGAGQALQCLNLMLGFPETWGLPRAGLGAC